MHFAFKNIRIGFVDAGVSFSNCQTCICLYPAVFSSNVFFLGLISKSSPSSSITFGSACARRVDAQTGNISFLCGCAADISLALAPIIASAEALEVKYCLLNWQPFCELEFEKRPLSSLLLLLSNVHSVFLRSPDHSRVQVL